WSKGNARGHSGVVFVEPFERHDELFTAQISSGALQRFGEDLRGRESVQLRCNVSRWKLVLLLQLAQFRQTCRRHIIWHGREGEENMVLEIQRHRVDQTSAR